MLVCSIGRASAGCALTGVVNLWVQLGLPQGEFQRFIGLSCPLLSSSCTWVISHKDPQAPLPASNLKKPTAGREDGVKVQGHKGEGSLTEEAGWLKVDMISPQAAGKSRAPGKNARWQVCSADFLFSVWNLVLHCQCCARLVAVRQHRSLVTDAANRLMCPVILYSTGVGRPAIAVGVY